MTGFFSLPNMLMLSSRDVLGLIVGTVGGLCVFVSVLTNELRAKRSA